MLVFTLDEFLEEKGYLIWVQSRIIYDVVKLPDENGKVACMYLLILFLVHFWFYAMSDITKTLL